MSPNTDYTDIVTSDDWICSSCGLRRAAHNCLTGFQRERYPFVGMLRIKNEGDHIAEVIESILPLCSRVFVLDDHSTDNTAEVCAQYRPVTVFHSPFLGLNERRDKNWLYDQIIARCEPEWILCIDGDEVLEAKGPDIIREHCQETAASALSFKLKIEFFWQDRHIVRVDRIYGDFWRPSLFRPYIETPGVPDSRAMLGEFRFMATPFGRHQDTDQPNLHCSSIPQRLLHGAQLCPARLMHYGYNSRERRVAKLDYYTSIDWLNWSEDCYRHMVQGDDVQLSELPRIERLIEQGTLTLADATHLTSVRAEDKLLHAGPVELIPWDETATWEPSDWARSSVIQPEPAVEEHFKR